MKRLFRRKTKPAAASPGTRTDSIAMPREAWNRLEAIAAREDTEPGAVVAALLELDELVNQHAEAEAKGPRLAPTAGPASARRDLVYDA
jgi:hypothetical protein